MPTGRWRGSSRGDPRRLLGFAFVHPLADKGRVDSMMREAVGELGLVGIKVHRHDARITREICAAGAPLPRSHPL